MQLRTQSFLLAHKLSLDGIVGDTLQYLEPFNFVDMLNWIVWNWTILPLNMCKQ